MPPDDIRGFHEATRHTHRHTVGGGMPRLGSAPRPPQSKGYAGGEVLPFPDALERLCRLSNGVLRWRSMAGRQDGRHGFRAAPCTGALYHVELYLACADLDGLPAGLYHHDVLTPGLRRLRAGDQRALVVEAAAGERAVAGAPIVLLLTSAFWRNAWKYGTRAYRHTYWDGGVVLANVLDVAASSGLTPTLVLGFEDALVDRILDLDGEREAPFALVALGTGGAPAPPAPAPGPIGLEDEPLFAFARRFPEIPAAHAATTLAGADAVRAWRAAAPGRPVSLAARPDVDAAITGRRSTRQFERRPITHEQLDALLERTLAPVPADVAVDAGALHLVVNAVEGLEPGLYRVEKGRPVLVRAAPAGELRGAAGRIALGQGLAADAAVDVCFLADLDDVLGRMGDRGWRVAHLGAAIAAGRLEVGAVPLGLGATGLTFYDDDLVELFGLDPRRTAVTYLAAVGPPSPRTRSKART